MNNLARLLVWPCWLLVSSKVAAAATGFDYVNPLIGTVNGGMCKIIVFEVSF